MKPLFYLTVFTISFQIFTIQYIFAADLKNPNAPNPNEEFSNLGKDDGLPRIQIRAILVRCPKRDFSDAYKASRSMNKNISSVRSEDILQFHGYDKDELLIHSEVKDCKRKLVITVKLNNLGNTLTHDNYIVVDHVYDPTVRRRSRLLNPIVFKLRQEQVVQLYGLSFIHMVNSEAREEVLNKNMANFTGCDTTSSKPTCGMSYIKDRVIPFSEGFCCSCDSYVNLKRQPSNRAKEVSNIGFSPGQMGTPIAGAGLPGAALRSARSLEEEMKEASGLANEEFLGKGLWGELYDNGFNEVKSFRVPRSNEKTSKDESQTTENLNVNIKTDIEPDKNIFDSSGTFLENEPDIENIEINGEDIDNSLPVNTDDMIHDGVSKNVNFDLDDSEYNSERDISDTSGFSNDMGLGGKEMYKPWLLQTDNKLNTFFKRLWLKDKKPSSTSDFSDFPIGIQLKHYENPPLEAARGFVESDIRHTDQKDPSPWDNAIPDRPAEPIRGKKPNDCHKYMHILSKLLQQGINLENDLHLAPEDIIQRCKAQVKSNRFIKSIIKKAEMKLKDKNINKDYDTQYFPPNYRRRYMNRLNHFRYRRDNKAGRDGMGKLTSITNESAPPVSKNDTEPSADNSSPPAYVLDIIWDSYDNFTSNYDSPTSNDTLEDLEEKNVTENLTNKNTTDAYGDENNKNLEIVWVKSLDYDDNNSLVNNIDNSFVNNPENWLENDTPNYYHESGFGNEETITERSKRNPEEEKFNIFLDKDGPVINIHSHVNNSDDLVKNITKISLNDLLDGIKINNSEMDSQNFFHRENDCRAEINGNHDTLETKKNSLNNEEFLNDKEINFDKDISVSHENNSDKHESENNQDKNISHPRYSSLIQKERFQSLVPGSGINNSGKEGMELKSCKSIPSLAGVNSTIPAENKFIINQIPEKNFFIAPVFDFHDQNGSEWENVTELTVKVSNGFQIHTNLSDHVNYANSELKESNNLNSDDVHVTNSYSEFDVIIEKNPDSLDNPEIIKDQNTPENVSLNLSMKDNPGPDKPKPDLKGLNKNEQKNFIENVNLNPQIYNVTNSSDELLNNRDKIYSENNLNLTNISSKTTKNPSIISNFSKINIINPASLDVMQKKLSFETVPNIEMKDLKNNYINTFKPSDITRIKINNSMFNDINSIVSTGSLNKMYDQKNPNFSSVYNNYVNVKNNFHSPFKSHFKSPYQFSDLDKISYRSWPADHQFKQINVPNIRLNNFKWRPNEFSDSRKKNNFMNNYNLMDTNKNSVYKDNMRMFSQNLITPYAGLNSAKNFSLVNSEQNGLKELKGDVNFKSNEQSNNQYFNNNSYNNFNNGSNNPKGNENISSVIHIQALPVNESQFTSIILPYNLTKEKGIKGKLLFIPDETNNDSLKNGNSANYYDSDYNVVKRSVDDNHNSSKNISGLINANNNYSNYEYDQTNTSDINMTNHTNSSQNCSKDPADSGSFKINENDNKSETENPEVLSNNQKQKKNKIKNKAKTKCKKKVKRQILSSGVQYRGGQSCIDRSVPQFADPVTYHESAHCLRFSDLWYSIYRLKRPFIEHSVHIQLYEKLNYPDGRIHWHEITKGMSVNVGTFVRHTRDSLPTLAFTYLPFTDQNAGVFSLDPAKTTLLIPQPLPKEKANDYPQAEGGPKQYMLVKDNEISFDGEECDKAGVSFEAFVRQPDRCARPRGTCLKNQPIDMWRHDMEAKRNNKPGSYFLENYASIPKNPFKMNQSTHEEFLALEYMGRFTSAIEVEVRSDLNAIVRTGSSGQITEIHVDATCEFHTRVTVIVTNLGLASSSYFPRLASCPVEVPEVWTKKEGPIINIPPQHRHTFSMSLFGLLPVDRFHCSMELLNERRELVATRRIRVQRHDRCLCQWHCLCACIGSINGLGCEPMSVEHYHAAGFQGSLPVVTSELGPEGSWLWHLYNILLIYFATLLNILFLGLLKALLGLCCCSAVSSWGVWLMFPSKAKTLKNYREPNISNYNVVKDSAGYAIHPINGTRNIRILSKTGEFCINIMFFAAAPIAIVIKLIQICCPCLDGNQKGKVKEPIADEEEEDDDLSEESKRAKSIKAKKIKIMGKELSETDSWSLPSDLELDEDEDTEFVMQEREASQKNLQENSNNARTRGGADVMDESMVYYYEFLKDDSADSGKHHRGNLSELEKEMAEHLVDTLQDAYTVYRNLKNPVGGVSLQQGVSYSLKGHFSKIGSGYQFNPSLPLLQYWTADNSPICPPITLDASVFEVNYPSAEDVMVANELSILPRGLVVNLWHSLDDESNKPDIQ